MGTDNNTDTAVLEETEVTITLADRTYTWREPKRKRARAMLKRIVKIAPLMEAEGPEGLAELEMVDQCLDFLTEFHGQMSKDREHLEDFADEQEIAEAFKAVSEMVSAPFARRADAKAEASASPTSTPSPESTN